MNSVNTRPAYELALETTIAALLAVRADGADDKALLGCLRAKMWDESFLEKGHRQTFLKRVNEALDQRPPFSMNQVRKADPTMLAAATSTQISQLIEVDELHGEARLETSAPAGATEWSAAADQNNRALEMLPESAPVTRTDLDKSELVSPLGSFLVEIFKGRFGDYSPDTRESIYKCWTSLCFKSREQEYVSIQRALTDRSPDDQFAAFLGTDEAMWPSFQAYAEADVERSVRLAEAVTAQATQPNSNSSQEQDTMNTPNDKITTRQAAAALNPHVAPAAPTLHVVTNEESVMPSTAPKSKFDQFLADLIQAGYANASERDGLYNAFLTNHLHFQPQAQAVSQAGEAGLSNDAQFFEFISQVKEAEVAFEVFLKSFVPAQPTAEERSQFSFRGERDDGVRAGWVAAGSALLGAALETGHRGTLSIGSGVGALAGVVGAYFAGEMLDKHIEGQFGRYVAAGTLGLVAGSLGSSVGRLAQGAVLEATAQESDAGQITLPAVLTTAPSVDPAVAALLGLGR